MIFRTLKMAGFKSFAEVAEVEIESGLTGIVGPNGCGKSNVVEGLRWVMGESSARQMRGGEMDDVIFAGTDQRPARNLAEITLKLDNSKRSAPAEFNNDDELEITRKIERGKGSSYYVNAKPARARDVQLLFADTATGARSSGIVSQGRIGAIVGAKPVDRRALLEEAANIRGLHARRHEAELRLRAAETNLERLDDVIAGLVEQRDSLKKQARQAARYRSVADRIRQAEAQLLFARWTGAQNDSAGAETDLHQAKLLVASKTEEAATIATTRSELAAQLPPLRDAEATRAAEYQRLAIGHDELDREEVRLKDALSQLEARQTQITDDINRENGLREDAKIAIESLASETETLQQQIDEAAPRRDAARIELETARAQANSAEAALADASALLRSAATSRNGLTTRLNDLLARREKATQNLADLSLDALGTQTKISSDGLIKAEADFADAQKALERVESTLGNAQTLADTTKADEREIEAQITRIQAEIDALEYLLADSGDNEDTPIVDQLSVKDDMETALAAYLADELTAPADAGTQSYWRDGMSHSDLTPPEGTLPLADFVSGSNALNTALAGVGVAEDEASAEAMQSSLRPGQAITTKSGQLWRWDGFVRHASQNDRSAERIR
ncbi:MAG: AAA family ATPase, partial [Candidatus Puniceispirillum sp.]